MHLHTLAAATVSAACLIGLGTAGTATAATTNASVNCSVFDPIEYLDQRVAYHTPTGIAGWIQETYDPTCGYVGAEWNWNIPWANQNPGRNLRLALGNPNIPWTRWVDETLPGNPSQLLWEGVYHAQGGPNTWRAGAMLDRSHCDAWTSLWNFNGTGAIGAPLAGCFGNDDVPNADGSIH